MPINLDPTKKYLLACSYGPDSMALFQMLLQKKINLVVAHINYNMRGNESREETNKLIAFCKENNVDLHIQNIDGLEITGNFQKRAREIRYDFFASLQEKVRYDILLTAHHADDFIETYLMQKNSKRKSFYYGIRETIKLGSITVHRPLLNMYKEEILKYCEKYSVPYGIDSSNLSLKYTRNKIRNTFLNTRKQKEKEHIRVEINKLNSKLKNIEKELLFKFDLNKIDGSAFLKLTRDEQEYLIYLLFDKKGIAASFSKNKATNLIEVISSTQTFAFIKLVNDVYISKFDKHFCFVDRSHLKPYRIDVIGRNTVNNEHFTAKFDDEMASPYIHDDQFPLTITNPQSGDKYKIKDYQKSINRLFIDMKMPHHYRLIWPVVRNKDGVIIYVPRYRENYISKPHDLFNISPVF